MREVRHSFVPGERYMGVDLARILDVETMALAQRVLAKAAIRLGGADRLAAYLKVAPETLELWLTGAEVPPVETMLRAADLLVGDRPFTS